MKSDKTWQNTILPNLERVHPDGIIIMLKGLYPQEEIIDAAFYHLNTREEIKLFFIEYGFYCRLCDPENENSEESMAMRDIIEYMMVCIKRFLPLWFDTLDGEVTKLLAYN